MNRDGLLIYDGGCGFCSRVAHRYADLVGNAEFIAPWQSLDLAAYGLSQHEAAAAVQWVDSTGIASGARAIARALQRCEAPYRWVGRLGEVPPFRQLGDLVYPIVARNRHRIRWP